MTLLEIKKHPNPILRKKCKEIEEVTEKIKKLAQDMIKTMEEKDGAGLAAPQIGKSIRIIAVCTEEGSKAFINPKIVKKTKETETLEEGCLSLPGIFLKVKRAKGVDVEALDIEGKKVKLKTEGIFARIFQHEIDHLDGILIIDKLNFFQKLKAKRIFKK
ncbi:MAG: peptide deformylase [Candidatus Nealsonbacteria bacterium]